MPNFELFKNSLEVCSPQHLVRDVQHHVQENCHLVFYQR